jgi:hypothetical protein
MQKEQVKQNSGIKPGKNRRQITPAIKLGEIKRSA